jgi:3-hydroxyacyl-[acyl-carrier-protein] dehydratase
MSRISRHILDSAMGPLVVGNGEASQAYRFDETFIGFQGHFPGYPLLPAVVQIRMGLSVAEEWKGKPLALRSVERAKFLQEIRPTEEVIVTCKETATKDCQIFEVRLEIKQGRASSFVLCVNEEEC